MSKSKVAATVLELLRANGSGSTRIIEGQRWVQTTLSYPKTVDQKEDGTRDISEPAFNEALGLLTARKMITADSDRVFVRLGVLLGETVSEEQPQPKPKQQPKEKIMFDVKTASMKDLVAKYNELNPEKKVNKFTDRKTAERRVSDALAKAQPKPAAPAAKATSAKASAKPRAPKGEVAPRTGVEAKYVRNGVRVAIIGTGTAETYKSTAEAFRQLALPMGGHIRFRGELKAAGSKNFEHGGKSYKFTVV